MRPARPVRPHRHSPVAFVILLLVLAAGTAHARGEVRWSSHIVDADGWLLAAAGDDGGVPVRLTVTRQIDEKRVRLTTTFAHGLQTLTIRRDYDARGGLRLRCVAGFEQLLVELRRDPATGDAGARFHLPDGRELSVTVAPDGEVLDGDAPAIRDALESSGRLGDLLAHYRRAAEPLRDRLPGGGDGVLPGGGPPPSSVESPGGCWDQCAAGCKLQCAFECAVPGPFCEICMTSCALGCAIGCGPSMTPVE